METLAIIEYEGYLQYTSHTAMIQLHSLNSELHSHKLNLLKNSNASCKNGAAQSGSPTQVE